MNTEKAVKFDDCKNRQEPWQDEKLDEEEHKRLTSKKNQKRINFCWAFLKSENDKTFESFFKALLTCLTPNKNTTEIMNET